MQAAGISWTFGRASGGPAISGCCWPAGVSARADDPERQVLGSESRIAVIPNDESACQQSALMSVIHEAAVGLQRPTVLKMHVTDRTSPRSQSKIGQCTLREKVGQ